MEIMEILFGGGQCTNCGEKLWYGAGHYHNLSGMSTLTYAVRYDEPQAGETYDRHDCCYIRDRNVPIVKYIFDETMPFGCKQCVGGYSDCIHGYSKEHSVCEHEQTNKHDN